MNRIDGKTALVTGGGRGIGAAVALRLAEQGADIAITYHRDAARAAETVARIESTGRRALAVRADAADPDEVRAAVARTADTFGRLDVLVNNAGEFQVAPLAELTPEQIDRTLAVNVRAPLVAAQAAAGRMTDGGRIIGIGSNVTTYIPFPGFSLYSASKTALIGMTKALARELGGRGITVNVVHPGATNTELNPADGPMADTIRGYTAVGRYAEPAEVAAMVAHLAGPDAAYVTGAQIAVDGGFTS
ncbi:SDR family NAD(P)-dependent oxidoreductase [Streptomyces qinzhouensis]|uniref:SDR family oxidoreductase n=1 Tax=Streptomyces qinzhouensis TaxID=2599401 RepID=A0A5B8JAD5_9ACTN|nr:SDR family oxidoreductase [Streptomyces qinzhouensis]QDY78815.1 SDR family oxidoreductase [Streptomyces qinzhouensis]